MNQRRGFTLIELLAVIAIILVLASLLFPLITQVRAVAQDALCKGNLHNIGIALPLFAADHDGVLPAGSVGVNDGDLDWQKCWLGQEVTSLNPWPYAGSWPEGRNGTLFTYMGGDTGTVRRIYRCAALPTGVIGSGYGSNGYFDYSMVMFWSGAVLSMLPTTSELRYTGDAATWVRKPSPIVVEEDPFWWMNRIPQVEPGHGNQDRIGAWHYGHGNYLAIDSSVAECRPRAPAVLNPFCNDWIAKAPSGNLVSIGGGSTYGSWASR